MQEAWEIEWKDYYAILQVRRSAEVEVIEGAYRRLAAKYHPDNKATGDADKVKLIIAAHEVLREPSRRERYDQEYERRLRQFRGWGGEGLIRERELRVRAEQEARAAREQAEEARRKEEEARSARKKAEEARERGEQARRVYEKASRMAQEQAREAKLREEEAFQRLRDTLQSLDRVSPVECFPREWTVIMKLLQVLTPYGSVPKGVAFYTNSIGMKLVEIPAGEFMMGGDEPAEAVARKCKVKEGDPNPDGFKCEYPRHIVRITKPFYMGAYVVTHEQYDGIMAENPDAGFKARAEFLDFMHCRPDPKTGNNPAVGVTWHEAVHFCKRLSQKEGIGYRLPTEAEWEYACRAGTTTAFYTGGTISTDQANYHGMYPYGNGAKGVYRRRTMPVGSFDPNGLGLFEMHGNVEEWCHDWFADDYYSSGLDSDPTGPAAGKYRVMRGGSCWTYAVEVRSAARGNHTPECRGDSMGFRVVCEGAVRR